MAAVSMLGRALGGIWAKMLYLQGVSGIIDQRNIQNVGDSCAPSMVLCVAIAKN